MKICQRTDLKALLLPWIFSAVKPHIDSVENANERTKTTTTAVARRWQQKPKRSHRINAAFSRTNKFPMQMSVQFLWATPLLFTLHTVSEEFFFFSLLFFTFLRWIHSMVEWWLLFARDSVSVERVVTTYSLQTTTITISTSYNVNGKNTKRPLFSQHAHNLFAMSIVFAFSIYRLYAIWFEFGFVSFFYLTTFFLHLTF